MERGDISMMSQGIREKPKHRGHSPLKVDYSVPQILYILRKLLAAG